MWLYFILTGRDGRRAGLRGHNDCAGVAGHLTSLRPPSRIAHSTRYHTSIRMIHRRTDTTAFPYYMHISPPIACTPAGAPVIRAYLLYRLLISTPSVASRLYLKTLPIANVYDDGEDKRYWRYAALTPAL